MRIICSVFLLFAIFSTPVAFAQRKVSEEAVIFNAVKDGVFTIFTDRGKGSGFLVDTSGLILTNSHVVASSGRVAVQIDDTTKIVAKVIAEDKTKDVAVLAIPPEAIFQRPVLKLANRVAKDLAFEGEKVLAIGSPLSQTRILTSGIVSKVEERTIISDVNINPGNSGGPLLNMDAEVIAINTFREQEESGPGISGSVSISEALLSLEKAKLRLLTMDSIPFILLPQPPKDIYPLWGLDWAAQRCDRDGNYKVKETTRAKKFAELPEDSDAEDSALYRARFSLPEFDIIISTPAREFYRSTVEKKKLAEKRKKREKAAEADTGIYDPVGDMLKEYDEHAPLVFLKVSPQYGQTGGSVFGNILGAVSMGSYYDPHYTYEFKADLRDFLMLDGDTSITEIFRAMNIMPVAFSLGNKKMEDIAQWGVFGYLPNAFDITDSSDLHFRIKDLKEPDKIYDLQFPRACIEQIWVDFEPYRDMLEGKQEKLLLADTANVSTNLTPPAEGKIKEDEKFSKLRLGASVVEVSALIGKPDVEYDASFGENMGSAWKGHVWLYFTVLDKSLKHVKRLKKNTLVFHEVDGAMKLNHWKIEE